MKLQRRYQVISEAALLLALSRAEERRGIGRVTIGDPIFGKCRRVFFEGRSRRRSPALTA